MGLGHDSCFARDRSSGPPLGGSAPQAPRFLGGGLAEQSPPTQGRSGLITWLRQDDPAFPPVGAFGSSALCVRSWPRLGFLPRVTNGQRSWPIRHHESTESFGSATPSACGLRPTGFGGGLAEQRPPTKLSGDMLSPEPPGKRPPKVGNLK